MSETDEKLKRVKSKSLLFQTWLCVSQPCKQEVKMLFFGSKLKSYGEAVVHE